MAFHCNESRILWLLVLATVVSVPMVLVATAAEGPASILVGSPADRQAEARILLALSTPMHVHWFQSSLEDVADALSKQLRIPVRLDVKALGDVGISSDSPVTFATAGISARSALDLILSGLDPTVTWMIEGESLLITTKGSAQQHDVTRIYPVGDLVEQIAGEEVVYGPDYEPFIDAIKAIVQPDSWDDAGGPGAIKVISTTQSLACSQTREVHEQIERLLAALRQSRHPAAAMSGLAEEARAAEEEYSSRDESQDSADRRAFRRRGLTIDPQPAAWRVPQVYEP
jgi:hypothetical protein